MVFFGIFNLKLPKNYFQNQEKPGFFGVPSLSLVPQANSSNDQKCGALALPN